MKIGDELYRAEKYKGKFAVWHIALIEDDIVVDDGDNIIKISDIGKKVFLSKAEAEMALNGDKNE